MSAIASALGVGERTMRTYLTDRRSLAHLAVRRSETGRWWALSGDLEWLRAQEWR